MISFFLTQKVELLIGFDNNSKKTRNKMQSKKNGSTNIQQKTSGNTKNKCLCGILHSFTTNKLSSKHFSLQRFLFHLRIIACSSHFVWHMTVCIICASCDKLSKISFCVALKAFDTFLTISRQAENVQTNAKDEKMIF